MFVNFRDVHMVLPWRNSFFILFYLECFTSFTVSFFSCSIFILLLIFCFLNWNVIKWLSPFFLQPLPCIPPCFQNHGFFFLYVYVCIYIFINIWVLSSLFNVTACVFSELTTWNLINNWGLFLEMSISAILYIP